MKTKPATSLKSFWFMLTEVPGWPDAPLWARLRRASPMLIPCLALLSIAGWQVFVEAPQVRSERAALNPLIALEEEITALQLAYADPETIALAERSEVVARLLFALPEDARSFLKTLKKEAADRGFEASFIINDEPTTIAPADTRVSFIPVRGKLVPLASNADPFPALLTWLDRAGALGKRIDLMRLSVRADDKTWQAVELNFRLVALLPE